MTDKKLLELAAKAEGRTIKWMTQLGSGNRPDETFSACWNPLLDDGDALRLAVKLNLLLMPYPLDNAVRVTRLDQPDTIVSFGDPPDPLAATRRAIVRAAAELAKQEVKG